MTARYTLALCAFLTCYAGPINQTDAAGPVAYRDCALSWNPNSEPDLAGYRVYMGRSPNQRTRMKDVGLRTAFRCSEGDAAENGQWFGTVTAYDHSGNESAPAQAVPFEIVGWPDPVLPAQLLEPSSARLTNTTNGVLLLWADMNTPQVSHRLEISSSLQPAWTTAIVQPPGLTRFSFYSLSGAEWVCYRVRGERGTFVSEWAQAGSPEDRQHCLKPEQLQTIADPILSPTILYEPASVRMEPIPPASPGRSTRSGRPGTGSKSAVQPIPAGRRLPSCRPRSPSIAISVPSTPSGSAFASGPRSAGLSRCGPRREEILTIGNSASSPLLPSLTTPNRLLTMSASGCLIIREAYLANVPSPISITRDERRFTNNGRSGRPF